MADDFDRDCEHRPCTKISIMQLFHELKQKFPYVPDRVVSECIRKNGHDKGACEWALEKENRAYLLHSYPPGLNSRMTSEDYFEDEICCRRSDMTISTKDLVSQPSQDSCDFDRRIPGRQSLDSLYRRHRPRKNVSFKYHSDEYLHQPSTSAESENISRFEEGLPYSSNLPNSIHRYNDDVNLNDLNLSVANTRDFNRDGTTEHHLQNLSFARNKVDSACHKGVSAVNRPSSLISETGFSGSGCESDLKFEFASDVKSCHCERTSVSVTSCSVERGSTKQPRSAPVTPSGYQFPSFPPLSFNVTTPRQRTALSLEPSPPYMAELESPSKRPFTRVNLTLRPPSADPQPPIDIRSSAEGGLTYSTCSYDPRQGYQSHLRISIGPGGQGSVSAARTKTSSVVNDSPPSSSSAAVVSSGFPLLTDTVGVSEAPISSVSCEELDSITQAVVDEQLSRKQRLEKELAKEKERLRMMQQEVTAMEKDLNLRQSKMNKHTQMQELKEEITRLYAECKYMTAEVDISLPGQARESSRGFYRNIYRGQEGRLCRRSQSVGVSSNEHPQEAPFVSLPEQQPHNQTSPPFTVETPGTTLSGNDGPNWTCNLCTFRNHPLLDTCEQCEMPRGVYGTSSSSSYVSSPNLNIISSSDETATVINNA